MERRLAITPRLPTLLLMAGLVAAAWRAPRAAPPVFVVPPAMTAAERPVAAIDAFRCVPVPQQEPSAHASSLAMAPDGSTLLAWFSGEREGASDVSIRMARFPAPGQGGAPPVESWISLTRERLQALTSRVIRKIGNPVLWFDGGGHLHMHVVSVSYGGWSGSAINQLVSDDEGRTWREARRLILSPFLNLSTLARTPPQVLQDGSIGVPAYHEFIRKWGLWVRVQADGTVLQVTPMRRDDGDWLQPAVVATSSTEAMALLRASGDAPRLIGRSRTRDGGRAWPRPAEGSTIDLPNPDSSVAMIRLSDGSLLMACNPLAHGRERLQLFRSLDGGTQWNASGLIELGAAGDEFSYPALMQDRAGRIHLSYTWKRQAIRLCSFAPEWLDGSPSNERPAASRMPEQPPSAIEPDARREATP